MNEPQTDSQLFWCIAVGDAVEWREGWKECFGRLCSVHKCWETKAARQIAQGHFLFQRSLGVKEAIFLTDNQNGIGQGVEDEGEGRREQQWGAK